MTHRNNMDISSKDSYNRGTHSLIGNIELSDNLAIASNEHVIGEFEDYDNTNNANLNSKRKLTAIDGIAIIVGIIIGSGIFSSPGLALQRCGSPGMVLIAWSISGILVMLTSFCYLELGSIMPSAGGDFDYLKRAYGDRIAFSFAWYNFFVGKTGSQAIIALIFGRYFEAVLLNDISSLQNNNNNNNVNPHSEESWISKFLAIVLVTLATLINCAGIKESALLSIILSCTKILLIIIVFIFSIIFMTYSSSNAEVANNNLNPEYSFIGSNSIFRFGSTLVACLWSFDGFADGNFLLEELKNPIRDLPRIICVSLIIVTSCYLFINIGYLSVLSKETIIESKAIAIQFGEVVSNSLFSGSNILPLLLALGVSLSTAGSVNGSIMAGGRAFFAVARDGKAPSAMAKLNTVGSPWVALSTQCLWTIVLLLLPGSNFATLLDYFGPASWLFYGLSASALITLRYKEPDILRPFKVPFYPIPPVIVITLAFFIISSSLSTTPGFTILALSFVALSFPVHLALEYYEYYQTLTSQYNIHSMLSTFDEDNQDL